ncbi:MAG TPA: O-antigen ligase family protein, partial [Pyrinomonadaceae bacterium]|nr:O-antigen ligase family protein [Pyrinomonadaceae bacterium]
ARPRADAATTLEAPPPSAPPAPPGGARAARAMPPRTLWSRFIILALCLAVVLSTLAFGTVHLWALGFFQAGAALVVALWAVDAWRTGVLRVSRNVLQLPLVGLAAVGVVQLLPVAGGPVTMDPYATRFVLVQLVPLAVYFAAALAFVDTPGRLRTVTRTVVVFGFLLAVYGLMQHFINPATIFWVREPRQAQPFGPYVNRHHFAGYMELTLALPLGLIFSGAVAKERAPLYGFAALIMAIALVMTNSRGGIISMAAEIFFLAVVAFALKRRRSGGEGRGSRMKAAAAGVALAFVMVFAVLLGSLYFGGEDALSRLVGTVNAADPTTGRAHFWRGTLQIIKDHPVLGVGLGAFADAYTRYDTGGGAYRLEQAHNDYLQILSDAGLVGALLGLFFVVALFRMALRRVQSGDKFRRGVALGALSGCAGVLVHSFFDFTLHTAANGLLFLLLAALATAGPHVEEATERRGRRRRRRRQHQGSDESAQAGEGTPEEEPQQAAA